MKWVERSDARSDELNALECAIMAARKARDEWLRERPQERQRIVRLRDSAPSPRHGRYIVYRAIRRGSEAERQCEDGRREQGANVQRGHG